MSNRIQTALGAFRRFAASNAFLVIQLILASIGVFCGQHINTVLGLAILIMVLLVLCDDIAVTTGPFFLICTIGVATHDYCGDFINYWKLALVGVATVIFHYIVYRRKWRIGSSFFGVVAVAIAVTLAGVGTIPKADYFAPGALYHTFGLGIGMVILYLLLKSQYARPRDYDVADRFVSMMCVTGLLCSFCIFAVYIDRWDELLEKLTVLNVPSRNNYATILMLALPFPAYRMATVSQKHRGFGAAWRIAGHLLSLLLMSAGLFLSGSRGGLLFGALELFLCAVYAVVVDKKYRWLYLVGIGAVIAVALMAVPSVLEFYASRLEGNDQGLISTTEARYQMLLRSWDQFRANIPFGMGIGFTGNNDIWRPRSMEINWYHMMLPQIVSGMGLVGLAAYAYQIFGRVRLILKKKTPLVFALALSYVGILLMNQVNPGEFCPLPNEFIVVLIFILIENMVEADAEAITA